MGIFYRRVILLTILQVGDLNVLGEKCICEEYSFESFMAMHPCFILSVGINEGANYLYKERVNHLIYNNQQIIFFKFCFVLSNSFLNF